MCPVFCSAAQGGGSSNPPLLSGVFTGELCVTIKEGVGGGVEKPVFSSWTPDSVLQSLCASSESSISTCCAL